MQSSIYEILDKAVERYKERERAKVDNIKFVKLPFGNTPSAEIIQYGKLLESTLIKLQNLKLEKFEYNIRDEFLKPYQDKVFEQQSLINSVYENTDKEIENIKANRERTIKEKYSLAEEYLNNLIEDIRPLLDTQSEIVRNKSRLVEVMELYNIQPDTFTISKDIGREELSKLFEIAQYGMNQTLKNSNVLEKVLSLAYLPLTQQDDDEYKDWLKYAHMIGLIALIIIAKPYFLGTVSVAFITVLLGRIMKARDLKEVLSLAYTLSNDVDLIGPLKKDTEYLALLKDAEEFEKNVRDIEVMSGKIAEESKDKVAEIESSNVKAVLRDAEIAFNKEVETINQIKVKSEEEVRMHLSSKLKELEEHYNDYLEHLKKLSSQYKFLAEDIPLARTMNTKIRTGQIKYKDIPLYEETIELPLKNISFQYKDDKQRDELINFMKVLLVNFMTNVREKSIDVMVYDNEDLSRDFAEFQTYNPENIFSFYNEGFNELIKNEVIPPLKESIAKTGDGSIKEFNDDADKSGKIAIPYRLLIVLSTEDEGDSAANKELSKLMEYSAKYGVFIWTLNKDKSLFDQRQLEVFQNFYKNDIGWCSKPWSIDYQNGESINVEPHGDFVPYKYTVALGNKYIDTMTRMLEDNDRIDKLDFETKYRQRYIPDHKIWSKSTRNGIALRLGLIDGDPEKPGTIVLGDDQVHCLLAGATGSGKSATINYVLAGLLYDYPPEELELVMIDFKNVEFAMYTDANAIPHAKVISGTKDGEYAISIFKYLMDEMHRRTALFEELKFQNIKQYNDHMEATGQKDKILPRILLLIDEFQVMFTEVDPKSTDVISKAITSLSKLARFCGCHMWFTSQSMVGTVGKDILDQFRLRISLNAASDTSTSLIGNNAASKLPKKGFLITNDNMGEDASTNKKWRIPYIPNDEVKRYVPKLKAMCKDQGRIDRMPEFYNEADVHEGEEINEFYEKNAVFKSKEGLQIMGERTEFSLNNSPYNFVLQRDDNENVLYTAFERTALMKLVDTTIYNLESRNVNYIINCPDKDTVRLLDLENRVKPQHLPILPSSFTAEMMFDLIQNNIWARQDDPELAKTELHILLVNWEKVPNFARNSDYKMHEAMKALLNEAPVYGIFINLYVREVSELKSLFTGFNHKIAAYTSEKDSSYLFDNSKANKLNEITAMHAFGSDQSKFKLYNFPINGEITAREIVV